MRMHWRTGSWVAMMCAGTLGAATPGAAASSASALGVEALGTETQAVRPVHRFLEVEISPDAKYVVAVEGDSSPSGGYPTVRDLVIRDAKTGKVVNIALPCGRVPQCWPGSPTWALDSKRVSFTLRTPGSHARSIYHVAADGSGLTEALKFNGTIGDMRYLPDGRLAMLAIQNAKKEVGATEAGSAIAGDLDAAPPEQRIAVLEQGALAWQSPADLFVYEYSWRNGGKSFVGTAAPGDGDNNWWTAKLYVFAEGGSAKVIYTPADNREQIATPVVSPDGSTVAFIAGIMSDFGSTGGDVYEMPVEGSNATNATPAMHASARAIAWRCDGRLQAEVLAGDKFQFVDLGKAMHPTGMKVLWSGEETFNERDRHTSTACPSNTMAFGHQSFNAPPEIAVGTLGKWRDITQSNSSLKAPGTVRSVWWQNDGMDVQGWLILPLHAAGKVPLIVSVHGGPAAAFSPQFIGPGTTTALLEHGYAVFHPNPRGSYGQGEHFTQANVRDLGHGDLRDILTGIDAAAKTAAIDTDRVGITGGSYGGFMSMWAVTQTNRFKAAVAAAGISNWLSYYGENGIDAWMIPYFGASAYDDPAVYARSSAINYMHAVKTPTFAYVGERDIECPAPQTQEFWHAMKAMNVPTAVMIYPGEGHGLRDPANLADAQAKTLAWFDQYLK